MEGNVKIKSKKILIAVLSLVLFGGKIDTIQAHPGRTDASGCHVCRTNCEKWGLSYGEYHCHNGSSSSSSSSSQQSSSSSASSSSSSQQSSSSNSNYYAELQKQQELEAQQKAAEEAAKRQQELEEAQRKTAEEEARKKKEAEEKKKQEEEARKKQEEENKKNKEQGEKDGYNDKTKNPDEEMKDLKDKDSYYKEGYEVGYKKAEEEVKTKTVELANKNGKTDARVKKNEDVPSGVMKTLYLSTYNDAFQQEETVYFKELDTQAKENAKTDVFNKLDEKEPEGLSENGKEKYQMAYASYKEEYQKEIEDVKAKISEQAKLDAEKNEKSDDTYKAYKDYKIYKDLKKVYDDVYSKNDETGPVVTVIAWIILIGLFVLFVLGIRFIFRKLKNIINRFKK